MDERPTEVNQSAVVSQRCRPWYHPGRWGFNFLTFSLLAHLLFGVGAAYLIIRTVSQKAPQKFAGRPANPGTAMHAMEHQVQMRRKQQTMSAPVATKRVTTTSISKVALPSMPAMPKSNASFVPISMSGMGGSAAGLGASMATGMSGIAGGGGLNVFGFRDSHASGLAGTFYDLKQTRGGQATDMAANLDDPHNLSSPPNQTYDRTLSQFIKGGLVEGLLGRYYRGPNPLYTSQIYIPKMDADNGPKAFNLQEKVQPKRWVVVYRGKVTPPVSGSYRFVGFADDVLAVRFNGRLVLEGSLSNPSGLRPKTEYRYRGLNATMYAGEPNPVNGGTTYPLELAIGERPGGSFDAFLLLEKVGENYEKSSSGAPILPVLKFAAVPTPQTDGEKPEVAQDTAWSIWKAAPNPPPPL